MKVAIQILLLLTFGANIASAQHHNMPLNRYGNLHLEALIQKSDSAYHTGAKPYIYSRMQSDELKDYRKDSLKYYYWLTDKLYRSHLFEISEKGFNATIDPLFNFEFGKDFRDEVGRVPFTNGRGFLVQSSLGKKVSFYSSFYETQAIVPNYLKEQVEASGVMHGEARHKSYKDGDGFDFATSFGHVAYSYSDRLNFQLGHGKHFIGDGYRSMLLSDFAPNYMSFKANWLFGKDNRFQYSTILAALTSLERHQEFTTPEALFKRKSASFHYLSINVTPRFQLGIFEGTIWKRVEGDSTLPFNAATINPVIGLNTALNGFDDDNNVLVGFNAKYRITKSVYLYGQLAVDDPSQLKEKYGWQAGVRALEPFGARRIYLQAEVNAATHHAYATNNARQNYAHSNNSLAHPLGANFMEAIGMFEYYWGKRWFFTAKTHVATYAIDTINVEFGETNFGSDIFRSDTTGIARTGGRNAGHVILDLQAGMTMNRFTNMRFYVGLMNRDSWAPNDGGRTTSYVYIGWRTFLRNEYHDF